MMRSLTSALLVALLGIFLAGCNKEMNLSFGKLKPPPAEDPLAGILPIDKHTRLAQTITDAKDRRIGIMITDRTKKVEDYLIQWQNRFIRDSYSLNNPPHPANGADLVISLIRRRFPNWTRTFNLSGLATGTFDYVVVVDIDATVPDKPPGIGHAAVGVYFIDSKLNVINAALSSADIDVPAKLGDPADAYMPAVIACATQLNQAFDTFITGVPANVIAPPDLNRRQPVKRP